MNTKKVHLDIVRELVEIYYNQVKTYLNIVSINGCNLNSYSHLQNMLCEMTLNYV
jgi:hypothetical protein